MCPVIQPVMKPYQHFRLWSCCVTVSVVLLFEIKVSTELVNNLFILEVVVVFTPLWLRFGNPAISLGVVVR